MLMPAQVAPFLLHEDAEIRQHAARYLTKAHDPSPATAEDFVAALEQHGVTEIDRLQFGITDMPQTERSLGWLLDRLGCEALPDDERRHFERAVAQADLGLLDLLMPLLDRHPHLSLTARDRINNRMRLREAPLEEVWTEFMHLAEAGANRAYSQHDIGRVRIVREALARGGPEIAQRAIDLVDDPTVFDWREWYAVELLGEMRWRPALDLLIHKLTEPIGDMGESVVEAIRRIGDVSAAGKLADLFPDQSWDFRIYAPGAIGRIKHPESEQALAHLLAREPDQTIRGFLADSLCDLCPTDLVALDELRLTILRDNYDRSVLDLRELLLTVGVMVGYEPAEGPAWRRILAAERLKYVAQWNPILEAIGRGRPDARDADEPASEPSDGPPVIETFRRDEPKIGRNEPCPCGSGRKYKKCWMTANSPI